MTRVFFDTNVILYLISGDVAKADRAESLIAGGGVISVQVLSEFVSVARRKLGMDWSAIDDVLEVVSGLVEVSPLTRATHDRARAIARTYQFSIYDASIVAAALAADCEALYTEDLQHGQAIETTLRVVDPFRDVA